MRGFIYQCPNTRLRIQAFTAEDVTEDKEIYVPVTCVMCNNVHHVNPSTGKVLSVDPKDLRKR